MGWPVAKPVSLGQRYADPVCPPTHRWTATSLATTAVEVVRMRPVSHQTVWIPGPSLTPAAESMLPWSVGVVVGVSP